LKIVPAQRRPLPARTPLAENAGIGYRKNQNAGLA